MFRTVRNRWQSARHTRFRLTDDANVREIMKFFRADEYGHRANIEAADLGYGWAHYGLIRQLRPARVLCIGSRHGYIPAVLAQACKDNGSGHVDFVDAGYGGKDEQAWTGVGFWKTKQGGEVFYRFGLQRFITLFVMTTQQFVKKHPEAAYEYIYIDGDHSYQGVKQDYELLYPLLQKNGLLVFHDVSVREERSEGKYGVWKLWQKVAKKNAIVFPFSGSGLGVLQKK